MKALALIGIFMLIAGVYACVFSYAARDVPALHQAPIVAAASPWPVLMLLAAFACGIMAGWSLCWLRGEDRPMF